MLYHGRGGDVAGFVHDLGLIAVLGFVAGWHVGRLRGRGDAGALVGVVCGVVAGSVASRSGATNLIVAALTLVIAAAESIARRRRLPTVLTGPLLALAGLALIAWLAGTPGSPLCDAASWLQPHGAWHVMSALLLLAWVERAQRAAAVEGLHP